MNKIKAFVLPGTNQYVRNYGYPGLDIWLGENKKDKLKNVEFFIGHSLGASFILNEICNGQQKYILINPLIKKRSFPNLLFRWCKFMIFEGIHSSKLLPIKYWSFVFRRVLALLKVDVLEKIKTLPKENVYIIRGKSDNFFCDKEDVEILRKNNFNVIEVEAGHDWNKNVAEVVSEIIGR